MEKITTAPIWAQWLLLVPLLFVLLTAAITDFRKRKVYNWLTYPAAGVALILHALAFGWTGIFVGFGTAFLVLFIGILMLPLGWLGGGDIKLLAVIGAALGPAPLFHIFFNSLLIGLVMGLSISLLNGYLFLMLKRVGIFLKNVFLTITTGTNITTKLERDERAYLPFAVPIFFGALTACTDVYLQWPRAFEQIQAMIQSGASF